MRPALAPQAASRRIRRWAAKASGDGHRRNACRAALAARGQNPPGILHGLLAAVLIAGCGGGEPEREVLRVFAASSLTEAFQELAGTFEAAYPEIDVVPVFAGSQVLRLQIEQGARADVFASADQRHLDALVRAGLVTGGRVFAGNELVVIVPRDNPAAITDFADLPRARRLVIGTEHVPAGRYARMALKRAAGRHGTDFEAAVLASVASEESNVRLARAKVELGAADAAIVYRTDAVPGRVRVIPLPDGVNVRADYLMGALTAASNPEGAELWIDFAASPAGQDIMTRRGFLAASAAAR